MGRSSRLLQRPGWNSNSLSPTNSLVTHPDLSVAEILAAYLDHAERHYTDADGNPTDEVRHLKTAIRHVRELYGEPRPLDSGRLP
jgi:hypothetical protein